MRESIPLFRLPSLVNTTPRNLNVSTCCSVLPLTCRIHCLGRPERHNTSIFLVLIFVPAWSHAAEEKNDQMCTEDPVEKIHACSTNSSAKSKRFFLQFTTMTSSSVDVSVTVYPTQLDQGSPNFLGEDHISCCTAVRGPDILRKVIFWGMLHSAKSTHFS